MDRNAPEALRDDVVQAERDCLDLIAKLPPARTPVLSP